MSIANFNDMELTFLSQRLKGKDVIDKETTESVIYTTKCQMNLQKMKQK